MPYLVYTSSFDAVQRTLSTFRTPTRSLRMAEQPDLSLGAHVWDCALILAFHFSTSLPIPENGIVVDLGAGCGLVGGVLASRMKRGTVWLTDTEQVIADSTAVNLPLLRESVREGVLLDNKVLNWEDAGELSEFGSKEKECLLVASDVSPFNPISARSDQELRCCTTFRRTVSFSRRSCDSSVISKPSKH